jgi:hypothetical protein
LWQEAHLLMKMVFPAAASCAFDVETEKNKKDERKKIRCVETCFVDIINAVKLKMWKNYASRAQN